MRSLLLGMLVVGTVLGTAASTALASPAHHFVQDVTGDVFECATTSYTITSGVVKITFHADRTASGNMNFTGTITPQNVVAVDEAGNVYSIVGAGWFGGTFNSHTGGSEFTDTEKYEIVQQGGGVVDSVNMTAHFSPNGTFKFLDVGTCEAPE